MTKEEAGRLVGGFQGSLAMFSDCFILEEREADGHVLVSGPADSLQYLCSHLERVDIDGDGEPDDRLVHWINIRLGSIDEERVHVRKIVAEKHERLRSIYTTDDGRTITCYHVDEQTDAKSRREIEAWSRLKWANREAYENVGRGLREQALSMID